MKDIEVPEHVQGRAVQLGKGLEHKCDEETSRSWGCSAWIKGGSMENSRLSNYLKGGFDKAASRPLLLSNE